MEKVSWMLGWDILAETPRRRRTGLCVAGILVVST